MTGTLTFNYDTKRLAIKNDNETYDLHCGTCIDVYNAKNKTWKHTRVENNNDDWYLTGLYKAGEIPINLRVRLS